MNWPTSQDYNEAIQNALTCLSDPDLKNGEPTVNAMGLPVPRSGNFADVYQFKGADGKMWAVKCFTRHVEGLQDRYTKINDYLEKAKLPFTVGFKYFAEGVRIRGQWYPVLKMEWVEGFTLNEFVRDNADKPNYLHGLMQMWAKLTGKLRDADIAHADLQHGNVLLVPGNTPSKLGLKLIDYDGMWVPPLADRHSGEVGHPNFQHPSRLKDRLFNADVDRFPHLVIACALRATLVGGKSLWQKFDNGDNLLFREQDLREPSKAPIFKVLWELNDGVVRALAGQIALSAQQQLRKTPWLDDLLFDEDGPRLSPAQENQVAAMFGVALPVASAAAVPANSAIEQFSDFEVVDDEKQSKRRPARARKKQVKKSKLPLLIGGGALALALIAGVATLTLREKKEPAQTVVQDDSSHRDAAGNRPSGEAREVRRPKKGPDPKLVADPKPAPDPREGRDFKDPDRRGAEWVLSIGGTVRLDGQPGGIKSAADLPKGAFRLTTVDLSGNKRVTDEGLAHLNGCKELTAVDLQNSQAGDAGLAPLKDASKLTFIHLYNTRVGDAGMDYLKECKNLTTVDVADTQVGDAGLRQFKDYAKLRVLNLGGSKVSDAGLASLGGLRDLHELYLYRTQLTDAGMVHFKDSHKLTLLSLGQTKVTDAGLANFQNCRNLEQLYLYGGRVGDSGLSYFKDCPKLIVLHLAESQVGDVGLANFKGCVNLEKLNLNKTRVTDAGLANFKGCKKLKAISLMGTQVSDAGLANLTECPELVELFLGNTPIGDRGLASFKGSRKIQTLNLNDTRIGDASLKEIGGLGQLQRLEVRGTKVTAPEIEKLATMLPKCHIVWNGGEIPTR